MGVLSVFPALTDARQAQTYSKRYHTKPHSARKVVNVGVNGLDKGLRGLGGCKMVKPML
jgi:hypothetical protein